MKLDEDNREAKQQSMHDKVNAVIAKVSAAMSFFTPELLSAPEELLRQYMDSEASLEQYRFVIEDLLREKKHVLSGEEENLLAQMSEVTDATNTIFTMLNNADIKFGFITDEDGEETEVTHGSYISLMESHNRQVRKSAYTHVYEAYKGLINTIASTYSYNVKTDVVGARIRKYSSARAAALSGDNIPEEVYDNLISVVHDYLPVLHRYIQLRKRILGVDELKMYDVYVPLVELPKRIIPFEEGVEIMKKGLAPLGEEYIRRLSDGVKPAGSMYMRMRAKPAALTASVHTTASLIFSSTTPIRSRMYSRWFTRWDTHALQLHPSDPAFTYGDHSIFTAEVASTVNESLLMNCLLKKKPIRRCAPICSIWYIEEFRTTLFRQTMFAEFEQLCHKYVEDGGSLTAQWLCDEYDKLNRTYFGPALGEDEYIRYEWARILISIEDFTSISTLRATRQQRPFPKR